MAVDEAAAQGSVEVRPEHILAGIVQGPNTASQVLNRLDCAPGAVLAELRAHFARHGAPKTKRRVPRVRSGRPQIGSGRGRRIRPAPAIVRQVVTVGAEKGWFTEAQVVDVNHMLDVGATPASAMRKTRRMMRWNARFHHWK